MRINYPKSIYIIVSIIFLISCRSFKSSNSIDYGYKGEIKLKGENNINLKFKITIDSLNIIDIKLYNITGFKIGNLKIYSDSIKIFNLYDTSYRKMIMDVYSRINSEIFFNCFIQKLIYGDLFEDKFDFERNIYCLNSYKDVNKKSYKMNVLSRECNKLFTIAEKRSFKLKKNRNFEIIVSDHFIIEILIKEF
jgi:hypothetical protein